jgi:hypothetical protein
MDYSRFIKCLVLTTATGLFFAINFPIPSALSEISFSSQLYHLGSPKTSALPPSTTSLTNPISLASLAENFRPVKANSRANESLPVIFGNRCKVPISAASPTSTSYTSASPSTSRRRGDKRTMIPKMELEAASRISQAEAMSTARPSAKPCKAHMTG